MNERIKQLCEQSKEYANQSTKDFTGDEPVVWMDYYTEKFAELIVQECAAAVPLYLAQPQRKPLTEEEIIDAVRDADLDWARGWALDETQGNRFATLARAIERAHGIGGEA